MFSVNIQYFLPNYSVIYSNPGMYHLARQPVLQLLLFSPYYSLYKYFFFSLLSCIGLHNFEIVVL